MKADAVNGGNLDRSAHDVAHFLNFAVQFLIEIQDFLESRVESCALWR